jgi:LmbE family N-acetylglucosaminyl deacetylase
MTGTGTPSGPADNEEKGDAYPDLRGYLMIFGGLMAYESRCRQKLIAREVNTAALDEAISTFLKWSETVITFNRKDHPDHIPQSSLTQSSARSACVESSLMASVASTFSTPRPMTPWGCHGQLYDHLVLYSMKSYPGSKPSPSFKLTYP